MGKREKVIVKIVILIDKGGEKGGFFFSLQ